MLDQQNRRNAFRLDDSIELWVRALDDDALNEIVSDFDRYRMRYCLKSHFVNQREARQPLFQQLKNRDSEIASYIESLEQQIILLAERLETADEIDPEKQRRYHDVNISSDGIRFDTQLTLVTGQMVELGMNLPTNTTQVVMIAEVVRVEPAGNETYSVSLNYIHIHDEDIEAIIRHMAKLQQAQLQARRAS